MAGTTPLTSAPPRYATRLSVLFACHAPLAVVLRRGPKRHFRLILWDLTNDTFELGQWMKGQVALCDLAPDGQKVLYWAAQYHRPSTPTHPRALATHNYEPLDSVPVPNPKRIRRRVPRYQRFDAVAHGNIRPRTMGNSWTAISTPPYFTALALWPSDGNWTGGGVFVSQRIIAINEKPEAMTPIQKVPMPRSIQIQRVDTTQPVPLSAIRPVRARPDRPVSSSWDNLVANGFEPEWLSEHAAPDLVFAASGCLYRLANAQSVPASAWQARAKLLYDFRQMSFEQMIAPAAARMWV
jgi:hypothetical protein